MFDRVKVVQEKIDSPKMGCLKVAWIVLNSTTKKVEELAAQLTSAGAVGSKVVKMELPAPHLSQTVSDHETNIVNLKQEIKDLGTRSGSVGNTATGMSDSMWTMMEHETRQAVHSLKASVSRLEIQVKSKSVCMGKQYFGSLQDVVDFVKTNGSGKANFGQACTFTVLANLAYSSRKDIDNKMIFRANLAKAKFGEDLDHNEKIIMASMSEEMPAIFGSVEDRRKGTALPKVKDADAWASSDGYGESGIEYKIEEVIEEITSI
jgi:hypothetical protein